MALGIMLSVVAVLAATLTLLPAVLGRLGTRIDAGRSAARLTGAPTATPDHAPRLGRAAARSAMHLHHAGWNGVALAAAVAAPAAVGRSVVLVSRLLAWPVTALRTGDAEHRDHPAVTERPRRLQPGRRRLRPRRARHAVRC